MQLDFLAVLLLPVLYSILSVNNEAQLLGKRRNLGEVLFY